MDEGFTDLDMVSAERSIAINQLAAKGIMEGRTATTFEPGGLVTRADMAQHIFAFLDLAVDTIVVDVLPDSVDGDAAGIELLDDDGDGDGNFKAKVSITSVTPAGRFRLMSTASSAPSTSSASPPAPTTGSASTASSSLQPTSPALRWPPSSCGPSATPTCGPKVLPRSKRTITSRSRCATQTSSLFRTLASRSSIRATPIQPSNSSGRCVGRYVEVDAENSGPR